MSVDLCLWMCKYVSPVNLRAKRKRLTTFARQNTSVFCKLTEFHGRKYFVRNSEILVLAQTSVILVVIYCL